MLASGPILKLLRLRSVCAPQYTWAGTFTSPMVSVSILNSINKNLSYKFSIIKAFNAPVLIKREKLRFYRNVPELGLAGSPVVFVQAPGGGSFINFFHLHLAGCVPIFLWPGGGCYPAAFH